MLAPQYPTSAHQSPTEMDAIGMDHLATRAALRRKRKAESQPENNERLSKRLSLLNLEQNGPKLYVPVENPLATSTTATPINNTQLSVLPPSQFDGRHRPQDAPLASNDEMMQVDDSKYKVYIYNMDDELSSESESEDTNNGKLVFLPDIEKHLKANRIPLQLLADPRADPAGMELVLYSIPRSISVPQEKDSVRKAIIEARTRAREKHMGVHMATIPEDSPVDDISDTFGPPTALSEVPGALADGMAVNTPPRQMAQVGCGECDVDSDAMELD